MASVRPITQFLVRIPNSSPTAIMMIARVRQNRICTSGGRSRTLTRGWPSRAAAAGRRPPPRIPNGPGLLSGAGSTGRTVDVTVRFHVPPTGIGSAGLAAAGSPVPGRPAVGRGAVRPPEVQDRFRFVGNLAGGHVAEDGDAVVGGRRALRGLFRLGLLRRFGRWRLIEAGVRVPDRAEAPAGVPVVPRRPGVLARILGHGVGGADDAGVLAAAGGRVSVSGRSYCCLHAVVRLRLWLR